jgi:tungstate transport system ATP-binding protein
MAAGIPVMALQDVRVRRGGRAVLEVDALEVRPGEILAVIGPNGAGKSTLLRVLGLLERADQGRVLFRGEPVTPGRGLAVRRRLASVFQDALLADATVADNVALGLRFRGAPAREAAPRVSRWLDRFGIGALAGRQARSLSGGEARRAALARALVLEPDLLLLDEPFSALDQPTRESLIADLGPILRSGHAGVVLVTHDRAEALALADRVGVLIGGRLLQVGPVATVFRAPASEAVARFVGMETILDGVVLEAGKGSALVAVGAGVTIRAPGGARAGDRVRVCLSPEAVSLSRERDHGAAFPDSRLAGRVARLAPAGAGVRVVVDCGVEVTALLGRGRARELGLTEGAAVTARFPAEAVHLLPAPGTGGANERSGAS